MASLCDTLHQRAIAPVHTNALATYISIRTQHIQTHTHAHTESGVAMLSETAKCAMCTTTNRTTGAWTKAESKCIDENTKRELHTMN